MALFLKFDYSTVKMRNLQYRKIRLAGVEPSGKNGYYLYLSLFILLPKQLLIVFYSFLLKGL